MKALLVVAVGNGGGLGSNDQNLFLANPCCWREPWFENCKTQIRSTEKRETEFTKRIHTQIDTHTWGKHIGMPPRMDFGGLKLFCKIVVKK